MNILFSIALVAVVFVLIQRRYTETAAGAATQLRNELKQTPAYAPSPDVFYPVRIFS